MKWTTYLPARPHGEAGWIGRLLTGGLAIAVLATAHPAHGWIRIVLVVGLVAFLVGSVLMAQRPYVALALLSAVAVGNALICGYENSNSLVLVLVAVVDIAVIDFGRRGNRPIVATGIGVATAFAVSAWWFDRPDSWYFSQLLWTGVLIAFGLNRRQ